jgi:hypothetical protein
VGSIKLRRAWRSSRGLAAVLAVPILALGLSGTAFAKGGTAKPPAPGTAGPWVIPTLPDPAFSPAAGAADVHGFDDTGFIQSATVSSDNKACPNETDAGRFGGTAIINGLTITVPCNMVIQMPANTLTWADFVNGPPTKITGFPSGGFLNSVGTYGSFELHAVGNLVAGKRIAGLMFASQQSSNAASGTIVGFDYANGALKVDTGDPANPAIVQINDPNGRFSKGQSPDRRFSVDDQNPTIHAGTGYPMCIPRTDPGVKDDALCPQQNRPARKDVTVAGATVKAVTQCRNFSVAGVAPPASGELSATPAGQYCNQFVMPAPPAPGKTTTGPDARQQAPFEIGDFIMYAGTLQQDGSGHDYVSAHTIEANVGIYTQPNTQPSYLAIGEFGVGSADPNANAASGVAQETQDRIFLESETTDVKTAVDIYMMDVNPTTGEIRNRWITPTEMTGEAGGGITTQNTGPQPQRARIRATKAPVGLLSQPTRTIRVAVRSLCPPQAPVNDGNGDPVLTTLDTCLNNAPKASNDLMVGQYVAPTFEFIFPENVKPGDPIVPNDLWHLPFVRFGEGSTTASQYDPGVGPLTPAPW